MCVIMYVDKGGPRPTEEMLRNAWHTNSDGAGFAWWEKNGKGKNVVKFKKGIMKEDEAVEFAKKLPLPYVAHFRIASVGGKIPTLTHPFVVSAKSPLALEGQTDGAVLFHNGHWGAWAEKAMDAAIGSNSTIPSGDWSDTRAIAWMVNIYGPGFFDLLPSQKGIIMTPDNIEVFTGPGWEAINGVWCSNDSFNKRYRNTGYSNHGSHTTGASKYCSNGTCTNKPIQGRTLCHSCSSKIDTVGTLVKGKDDSEDHSSSSSNSNRNVSVGLAPTTPSVSGALSVVTGGASRPQKRLSLIEVEQMNKARLVSNRILKKFRKECEFLGTGGTRAAKAERSLRRLSEEIAERLEAGSKR